MKKYMKPQMVVVELKSKQMLMAVSDVYSKESNNVVDLDDDQL